MKPSSHTESTQSASTHYAPSVPMSVHRELAAELRANKAVIDSLNNRNEQLLKQNQRLKQEIHHVVQAAVNLGHAAGVTRGARNSFYNGSRNGLQSDKEPSTKSTGPFDTSASSGRTPSQKQRSKKKAGKQISQRPDTNSAHPPELIDEIATLHEPSTSSQLTAPSAQTLVHRPLGEGQPEERSSKKNSKLAKDTNLQPQKAFLPSFQFSAIMPKLFTEESGGHQSALLEKSSEQEIGGIWLALSILLIVVTAFGAGFLIMKPMLGRR